MSLKGNRQHSQRAAEYDMMKGNQHRHHSRLHTKATNTKTSTPGNDEGDGLITNNNTNINNNTATKNTLTPHNNCNCRYVNG